MANPNVSAQKYFLDPTWDKKINYVSLENFKKLVWSFFTRMKNFWTFGACGSYTDSLSEDGALCTVNFLHDTTIATIVQSRGFLPGEGPVSTSVSVDVNKPLELGSRPGTYLYVYKITIK